MSSTLEAVKHTPLPWIMHRTPPRGDGRRDFAIHSTGRRQSGDGDTVFTVATVVPSYEPGKRSWIHDYTEADAEANAHLIAAAPDLLNALEIAFEWFDQHGDGAPDASGWQKQALNMSENLRAIILKAKGEQ